MLYWYVCCVREYSSAIKVWWNRDEASYRPHRFNLNVAVFGERQPLGPNRLPTNTTDCSLLVSARLRQCALLSLLLPNREVVYVVFCEYDKMSQVPISIFVEVK